MFFIKCGVVFYYITMAVASLSVRPAGWLDRLVMYHKHQFYNDLNKVAPVQITATIERAPPGYVDSTAWDLKAVLHLLVLIRESHTAAPVRRALRRALRPARRFMNWHQSFKAFPSLSKGYEFYYDIDTDEDYQESQVSTGRYVLEDDDVIVVGNPVEARLPSAQISVRLLRDILEARAQAGRIMPTTLRTPIVVDMLTCVVTIQDYVFTLRFSKGASKFAENAVASGNASAARPRYLISRDAVTNWPNLWAQWGDSGQKVGRLAGGPGEVHVRDVEREDVEGGACGPSSTWGEGRLAGGPGEVHVRDVEREDVEGGACGPSSTWGEGRLAGGPGEVHVRDVEREDVEGARAAPPRRGGRGG
ncbi:uncharacterized protein LOC131842302 [Achroia grisella]|uniref:uncharacterized protein LOC131842302 n=1 Tax=Achroia grisella TaxID=688607 RepID=UPI0027D2A19E|nr:uncharacterized protein LOC131842302 [Achroia grisella]